MYDVIGDIHGHAGELRALLGRLGYVEHLGAYRHPGRMAVFLGDFIDRGPEQRETVRIVRRMMDAGSAVSVMGNHELNAIAWYLPDEQKPGEHLRPHSDKNLRQHAAFLAEMEGERALHRELIDWFLTLPLWLELEGIRVVHACWHPEHMARLAPALERGRFLTRERMQDAARKGTPTFQSVEVITKGLEVPLPEGRSYEDKERHVRTEARVRWWDPDATTYRTAAILTDEPTTPLPDDPIPDWARLRLDTPTPIFVGHYWFSGEPRPCSRRVACVDYSAGKGGPLVAYRWDGEPELSHERFVGSRG